MNYTSYGEGNKLTKNKSSSVNSMINNYILDESMPVNNHKDEKITDKFDLELVKNLVDILSKKRATDYKSWLNMGILLHTLNSKELLKHLIIL